MMIVTMTTSEMAAVAAIMMIMTLPHSEYCADIRLHTRLNTAQIFASTPDVEILLHEPDAVV